MMLAEMKRGNNVVAFNKDLMFDEIEVFFGELELQSSNTRQSYESRLRKFFSEISVVQKKLEYLTLDDITKIKRKDIMSYRQELFQNENYKNSTLNHFFSVVKSLYNHLLVNEYEVNPSIFTFKKLKENDSEEHGNFVSVAEAENMAQLAYETERVKVKRDIKRLLILVAIRTSLRIDELLNLKWSNINPSNGVYKVNTIGKGGKKVDGAITEALYSDLLSIKKDGQDVVFKISEDSVRDMMKRLCKKAGIPEERNIVFHSFRSVAADWEMETSGNIQRASAQLNHSSTDTTYKHYLKKNKDYSQLAGVRMEENIDLSVMDDMSHEDFKEFIEQGSYSLQYELVNFMKNKQKV